MVGGGIAGILALQAAGAFDSYKQEEPSYTVRHSYPCSSPTAYVPEFTTDGNLDFSTGCSGDSYESRY